MFHGHIDILYVNNVSIEHVRAGRVLKRVNTQINSGRTDSVANKLVRPPVFTVC